MFDGDNIYVAARCWDSAPPGPVDRQRDAARHATSCARTTTSASCFDTFHDRRNGFIFYTNPLGALRRPAGHRRGQPERRLEPGVGRADRPIRGRLDGRDGDSVQVAPLPLGRGPDLGHPDAALDPPQERVVATSRRVPPSIGGSQGIFRVSRGGDAGRARPAAGRPATSRSSRTRISRVDDRPARARPRSNNDVDGDVGVDAKYGITANLTADVTVQHRLRAGRGRRAAGEPHALQPLLPREARVLPRGARHLRLRPRWRRRRRRRPPATRAARARRRCSTAAASA